MRPLLLAAVGVLLLPATGTAQHERYELGRRLKRFEAEWEKVPDPAARKRALAILPAASTQFLTLNLTGAAKTVDDAYWALKSAEPPAAGVRWLDALCVVPEKRVVAVSPTIKGTVRQLYSVAGARPDTVTVSGPRDNAIAVDPGRLPATVEVPTGPPRRSGSYSGPKDFWGDGRLTLAAGGAEQTVGVTVLTAAAAERLAAPGPADRTTLEGATAAAQGPLVAGLRAGDTPDTDLPVAGWCDRLTEFDRPYFTPDRPGDHWLAVPTGADATPCRLFVPPGLSADEPVPLVVALHGAGGSEHMFFESYGAGHIVKECAKRGWLLVAPRCGLLTTPPVAEVVAKLRDRYPIDPKRVFLVGHSMGAGQAAEAVQRHPGTFAALAVLGGGGRVRQPAFWKNFPVFVGMGTADFARRSGKAFVKALADAGAGRVTAKEYEGLEHLLIVREALPDVFAGWDGIGDKVTR